jgi:hypothetical protein
VFDRIHCSCRIRFIRKIGRYSSVGDFTVHIFNQMDFDRFLPNFTDRFFQKLTKSEGTDFSVSTVFLTRLMLRRSESIRNQIQQTLRNPLPPSLSRLNGSRHAPGYMPYRPFLTPPPFSKRGKASRGPALVAPSGTSCTEG